MTDEVPLGDTESPQWLEQIAYEGALFAATKFLYAASEDGVWIDLEVAKDIAENWKPGVLAHYQKIYYDAIRGDSGVCESEVDNNSKSRADNE